MRQYALRWDAEGFTAMAKWLAIGLISAVVIFGGCAGLLIFAHSDPSTADIDEDLRAIRTQIRDAEEEDARYAGGLIKAMVELRREVLRSTGAMLEQKRASLLRRIDLRYVVASKATLPGSNEKLSEIKEDLKKANDKLLRDQMEAQRYSGGLIQALSLTTVATDRLTIAQLDLAYYSAKYGLALPFAIKPEAPEKVSPGAVVKDNDALH
jgi:hypothetical protein